MHEMDLYIAGMLDRIFWPSGLQIHINEYLPATQSEATQVRFPRSKKRRIVKKWRFQMRNYKWFDVDVTNTIYKIDNVFYIHPKGFEKLKEKLEESGCQLQRTTSPKVFLIGHSMNKTDGLKVF